MKDGLEMGKEKKNGTKRRGEEKKTQESVGWIKINEKGSQRQ